MKGAILLTEGRSGSNWLGSLVKSAGDFRLGRERFAPNLTDEVSAGRSDEAVIRHAIAKGATGTAFSIARASRSPFYRFQLEFGFDPLDWRLRRHDIKVLLLTRRNSIC